MNKNNGFSLIELSIVLIIIGLLVAGVTGGATLIKNAELRAVISEIRGYETAVNAYYTDKGYLPGTNNESKKIDGENAWKDLYDAGIIDFDAIKPESYTYYVNTSMPASKVKGGGYILSYIATDSAFDNASALGKNSLVLTGDGSMLTKNTAGLTGVLSGKDTKFFDEKMDDGLPDSGKIIDLLGCSDGGYVTNSNAPTGSCSFAYKLSI